MTGRRWWRRPPRPPGYRQPGSESLASLGPQRPRLSASRGSSGTRPRRPFLLGLIAQPSARTTRLENGFSSAAASRSNLACGLVPRAAATRTSTSPPVPTSLTKRPRGWRDLLSDQLILHRRAGSCIRSTAAPTLYPPPDGTGFCFFVLNPATSLLAVWLPKM